MPNPLTPCQPWKTQCLDKSLILLAVIVIGYFAVGHVQHVDAADGKKYQLRYQFRANQFGHYQVVHNTRIKSQYNEAALNTENETTTWRHFRVTTIDNDGNAALELTIDRVILHAESDEGKPPVAFDTANPDPQLLKDFSNVMNSVGRPLARMTISPTGKLIDVTPLQGAANGDKSTEFDPNDAGLNIMIVLPEEPIAVGEAWNDDFSVEVNVTAKLKKQVNVRRVYQLTDVDGDLATIQYKTTLLSPVNDPALKAQLIMRTPKGKIVFDTNRGQIVSREMSVDELVLGPFGAKSSMHAVSSRRERLLDAEEIAQSLKSPGAKK